MHSSVLNIPCISVLNLVILKGRRKNITNADFFRLFDVHLRQRDSSLLNIVVLRRE